MKRFEYTVDVTINETGEARAFVSSTESGEVGHLTLNLKGMGCELGSMIINAVIAEYNSETT